MTFNYPMNKTIVESRLGGCVGIDSDRLMICYVSPFSRLRIQNWPSSLQSV